VDEATNHSPSSASSAWFGLGLQPDPPKALPSCLVLGNFDGVHLGHQAILAQARATARQRGVALTAVTFEPHPRAVVHPGQGPCLLAPLELRRRLLAGYGVDWIWVIPFDKRIQQLTPEAFMDRLRDRVTIQEMVVGPVFSIGKRGEGGLDFLQGYAAAAGFQVRVAEPVARGGASISSSAIRSRLEEGALDVVREMLGRPFQVLGEVVHGDGLGRRLGFPTANLRLSPVQALPADGVYVMELTAEDGIRRGAVGSIGTRPHFQGTERRFEVHCLDEAIDLYGQTVLVNILQLLRGQQSFSTDGELVDRMTRDAEAAAAYFASGAG
jgi:riboflavin kinase/FMN adenylyltransferase